MAPFIRTAQVATILATLGFSPSTARSVPHLQARVLSGSEDLRDSYDYVIVGGGTAGLTVGDRLSEDGKSKRETIKDLNSELVADLLFAATVLVIENGELSKSFRCRHRSLRRQHTDESHAAHSHEINDVANPNNRTVSPWWLYNITSAPNSELNNLQSTVYAASMVGGGSAINGMQATRGTIEDYDRWGSFFGSESTWTWEGILPYFKKVLPRFSHSGPTPSDPDVTVGSPFSATV
jgi:choline dehydrogenase